MITLLNAAPDTGNQGVSALCHSVVNGLTARGARVITVADHGRGLRKADWGYARVNLIGLTHSRRIWRGDSLRLAHALAPIGGGGVSAPAYAIARSRAVCDMSGGDSFTDIYGPRRFRAMALSKKLALKAGVPLILLPQKLGPFRDPCLKAEAIETLRRATAVWVRDAQSFEFLRKELGSAFDPDRHRLGLDVAFALPEQEMRDLPARAQSWLAPGRADPVVGLNTSGLLCNQPGVARRNFDLAASHADQIEAVARALLIAHPTLKILLISHVHRPGGDIESDLDAARSLRARLGRLAEGRVAILEGQPSAMELKWVLARLDWFAGARMHATIGALSSRVPTLGLGYTDKARGVFNECGLAHEVADLRRLDARALAERAVASFDNRHSMRAELAARMPQLCARAAAEMDEIARQTGTPRC
ncbi:MAG: polysaccharide pyruvyl transferase family protein [Pseudomonadota bacterium]